MIYIQPVKDANSARAVKLLECTPDQLRMVADRLEFEARNNAVPGQLVMQEFTKDLVLVYDPPNRLANLAGLNSASSEPATKAPIDEPTDNPSVFE